MTPKVSVVIRVRNEVEFLRQCLSGLGEQDYPHFEIVVVDNESTDGSRALAMEAGARVVPISRADFTYGRALNQGLTEATGEVALLLSAHVLPVGRNFLREAVAPFENARVAAVRCTHVLNRWEVEAWIKPRSLGWPASFEEVASRGPVACACAIRRSVWEMVPFDEQMAAAEDKFWAYEVLRKGFLMEQAPALFLYLRERHWYETVRILQLNRLAFYERTGRHFPAPPRLAELMYQVFLQVPRRALRQTVQSIYLYCCLKTIPWRARRRRAVAALSNESRESV